MTRTLAVACHFAGIDAYALDFVAGGAEEESFPTAPEGPEEPPLDPGDDAGAGAGPGTGEPPFATEDTPPLDSPYGNEPARGAPAYDAEESAHPQEPTRQTESPAGEESLRPDGNSPVETPVEPPTPDPALAAAAATDSPRLDDRHFDPLGRLNPEGVDRERELLVDDELAQLRQTNPGATRDDAVRRFTERQEDYVAQQRALDENRRNGGQEVRSYDADAARRAQQEQQDTINRIDWFRRGFPFTPPPAPGDDDGNPRMRGGPLRAPFVRTR